VARMIRALGEKSLSDIAETSVKVVRFLNWIIPVSFTSALKVGARYILVGNSNT